MSRIERIGAPVLFLAVLAGQPNPVRAQLDCDMEDCLTVGDNPFTFSCPPYVFRCIDASECAAAYNCNLIDCTDDAGGTYGTVDCS